MESAPDVVPDVVPIPIRVGVPIVVPADAVPVRAIAIGVACLLAVIGNAVGDIRAAQKRAASDDDPPRSSALSTTTATPATPATVAASAVAGFARPEGWGPGQGFASGQGFADASHGATGRGSRSSPRLRQGTVTVSSAKLPVEVVQRIVRQNFGRFRLCYEAELKSNPRASGRVTTKLVIGRDGAVTTASDGGSTFPSTSMVACVTRSYMNISFPQPEGGIVTVTFPVEFSPD